jgi:flagellar hook assembly protein FlgD
VLAGARPDPIVGPEGTRFDLRLAAAARVGLSVYDASGRLQRRFPLVELPAGRHAIHWDGRDDSGRPVASGVYFLRADFGGKAPAVAERVAVIR